MAEILYGKPVALELENKIKKEVLEFKDKGIIPTLLILKIGENEESEAYAKNIKKVFANLGIEVRREDFKESISFEEVLKLFNDIEKDNSIHGILLLRPLPSELEKLKVYSFIPEKKDIEGLSYISMGKLFSGEERVFVPCTPLGVIEILNYYNIPIEGEEVVIVGRSISVGRPLALLFLQKNATVTICHSKTKNISEHTKRAKILISAVGRANFITEEMVSEESIVVDVGTNVVDGKIVGDVDFERVEKKVKAITPVPGGVGVVTTRILAKNLLEAIKTYEMGV